MKNLLIAFGFLATTSAAFSQPYWQAASNGYIGPSPVFIQNVGSSPEYICRAGNGGTQTPGNLSEGLRSCAYIDFGGKRSYTYEVLQDPNQELVWKDRNALTPDDVAFVGGWKLNRPQLFICRPNHDRGGFRYGGSLEGSPSNGVCFIPNFQGNQDQTFDYEVLVYRR